MLLIDHTGAVRERPSHVQAELTLKIVIPDRLLAVRQRIDGCCDIAVTLYQHHGVATPAERAPGDAAEFRCVRGGGGLHIGVIGAAETMDAKGYPAIDVV